MSKPKKAEVKKAEVPQDYDGAEAPVGEENAVAKAPAKASPCRFCHRVHVKTFDGFGINHDRFDIGSKAERMFDNLVAQPLVPFFSPFQGGEKPGAIVSPVLNGLRVNILKGVMVKVPRQIAEILAESMNATSAAPFNLKVKDPLTGEERPALLNPQAMKSELEG